MYIKCNYQYIMCMYILSDMFSFIYMYRAQCVITMCICTCNIHIDGE
jgi:hypothetical protein